MTIISSTRVKPKTPPSLPLIRGGIERKSFLFLSPFNGKDRIGG